MIPGDRQVTLQSGEIMTVNELFEGLVLLAKNEATYPILGPSDGIKAVVSVAVEALEWAQERGML